jgi:hypothetical protein
MALKSSRWELQHCFRPRPDRRSRWEAMTVQSPRSPNRDSFGTPLWESQDKKPFGCSLRGITQSILYEGRWWLPPSSGHGESSEVVLPVACPNTKCVPGGELTHSWLVLCRKQVSEWLVLVLVLIPELQHAPLPLFSAEGWERAPSPSHFCCWIT